MQQSMLAKIDGLGFGYHQKPLFKDLDLKLESGNIYGLLGKNGAGKTTLLKLLVGQLFAQEGRMEVLGHEPKSRSPKLLEEIFYLSEEFYLPRMKSETYLAMLAPFYPRFNRATFDRYAQEFELDLSVRLDRMSLGQKKKYMLAFGLASNTKLLVMDEPTNGLDIPSKRQFRQIVASAMNEERTFIISTHQVRDMEGLIDPIIVLDAGKVIFNEALERIVDTYVLENLAVEPDEEVLYKEKVFGGYLVLRKREEAADAAALDLEAIFNIIIQRGGNL